jgi:hypothetical protein
MRIFSMGWRYNPHRKPSGDWLVYLFMMIVLASSLRGCP